MRILFFVVVACAILSSPMISRAEARWRRCRIRNDCLCQPTIVAPTCGAPTCAAPAEARDLQLAIECVGNPTSEDLRVRATVTNTGSRTLVWDRDFAAFLEWRVIGGDPPGRLTSQNGESNEKSGDPAAKRFVSLAPGACLSQEINLTAGFRTFVTGHGTSVSPEGYAHIPVIYEERRRFNLTGISRLRLTLTYSPENFDTVGGDVFNVYFGKPAREIGLSEGRFESNTLEIELPR